MRSKLTFIIAAILAASAVCRSQAPAEAPAIKPSPVLAGIAHIALRVANLDASEAFYQSLGFDKPFELSHDGKAYEAFIKINDRQFIELYPATPKDPQVGFLHICFEGNGLAAARAYYLAHGLLPTEVSKGGAGNLLFSIKGLATPQGPQNIEYTQYMPGSMHSRDFGQHLGSSRIATSMLSVSIPFDDAAAARTYYAQQLGFTSAPGGKLTIPGSSDETVAIASSAHQHFFVWVTLGVGDLAGLRKQLDERKLLPRGARNSF